MRRSRAVAAQFVQTEGLELADVFAIAVIGTFK
jgi:hypothetical protein